MTKYVIVKRDFAVIGIILILAVGLYLYSQKVEVESNAGAAGVGAGVSIEPASSLPQEIHFQPNSDVIDADACKKLNSSTKISCKDALEKATTTYPGNVYGIIMLESSWAIGIELHQPMNVGSSNRTRIEVDVDFDTGKMEVK